MVNIRSAVRAFVLPLTVFSTLVAAHGQVALPQSARLHAYEASPDVYKLLEENDHFRVILATWHPGQSDQWHTHHGNLVNYALTDCNLDGQGPDGQSGAFERRKGESGFNSEGSIHKVANVGDSDCILLIVERK
jgi:hypothetical protein